MKRHRRVLIVLGVVALGLAVVASISGIGIGANDDPFTVTITNNTPHPIVDHSSFGAAYGTKDAFDGGMIIVLKPGQSFQDAEFANEGVHPDRITSVGGKTIGCLPFQFSENVPKPLVVKVTERVPCRHWIPGSNLPKDWPDANY